MKYKPCNKCGHEILASAKFCDECGYENYIPKPWNPPKRKPTLMTEKDESKPVKIAKITGFLGLGLASLIILGFFVLSIVIAIFYMIPKIILAMIS